jgi:hypothetical protein
MTREGHLEMRVQPVLETVHLLLLGIGLTWGIPHHAGETSGVLLNLLGALGDVAKLLHLDEPISGKTSLYRVSSLFNIFVRYIVKWFINLKRDYYPTLIQRCK